MPSLVTALRDELGLRIEPSKKLQWKFWRSTLSAGLQRIDRERTGAMSILCRAALHEATAGFRTKVGFPSIIRPNDSISS